MATNDLLTAQEAADALAGSGTPDATKLAMLNTAVSEMLDETCGPIVTRAVTKTFASPTGSLWLPIPVGSPTFTVAALVVTEYTSGVAQVLAAETLVASTANDYIYDPTLGRLRRRASWSDTSWAPQAVTVAYTAGRYGNTGAVGAKFKQAAKIILAHEWALEQGFASLTDELAPIGSGFAVPRRALEFLKNERLDEIPVIA